MKQNYVKHDRVVHRLTGEKGIVIDVNFKWGWIRIRWEGNVTRQYDFHLPNRDLKFKHIK